MRAHTVFLCGIMCLCAMLAYTFHSHSHRVEAFGGNEAAMLYKDTEKTNGTTTAAEAAVDETRALFVDTPLRAAVARTKKTITVDLVVARYNENVSFLGYEPFSKYNIVCYNKGRRMASCPGCVRIVPLPNVGKCDHTYLYHIIQNYNNLADVTIFVPGSCTENDMKQSKTMRVCHYVDTMQTSAFIGEPMDDVALRLYDFTIASHITASKQNQRMNSDTKVKPCALRPFGKWHDAVFGSSLRTTLVDYNSIFAVAREHIRQHPRKYYERLIKFVDDDISPECGHFIERAWVSIFSPLPDECLYNSAF